MIKIWFSNEDVDSYFISVNDYLKNNFLNNYDSILLTMEKYFIKRINERKRRDEKNIILI